MGVYIPDIKLPKDEPGAFLIIVMYVGADGKLRAECEGTHEVIPVPPHGRLGNLDKLENEFSDGQCYFAQGIKRRIRESPTIIPADPAEGAEI